MPAKQMPIGPEEVLLSILQHPLRKRLLRFYVEAEGTLSPKELTLLTNDPKISNVGYHVRVLAEKGAVELVETQPRRARSSTSMRRRTSLTRCLGVGRHLA